MRLKCELFVLLEGEKVEHSEICWEIIWTNFMLISVPLEDILMCFFYDSLSWKHTNLSSSIFIHTILKIPPLLPKLNSKEMEVQ